MLAFHSLEREFDHLLENFLIDVREPLYIKTPDTFLCGPSLSNKPVPLSDSLITYNDRFAFRGEKPMHIQSSSRPESYLRCRLPNPTIDGPHILGSSPVSRCIISDTVRASARCCSSAMLFKNFSTLAVVCFVFRSAFAIVPRF